MSMPLSPLHVDALTAIWREDFLPALPHPDRSAAYYEAYILHCNVNGTQRIIDLAKAGDERFDLALRRAFRRMIERGETPNAPLRDYGLSPPPKPRRGPRRGGDARDAYDFLTAIFIVVICGEFGLNPTRDQASRHRLPPSGCSVMQEVLARCGDAKDEATIQNIYWRSTRVRPHRLLVEVFARTYSREP